jgi:hypothetical protein
VTTNESPSPATTIPLIRDSELRLAKMRRQLEDVFRSLHLVNDEISVVAEAARAHGLPEIASVLDLSVSNRLFGQLKLLTNIIERLGGNHALVKGRRAIITVDDDSSHGDQGCLATEGQERKRRN